MPACRGLPWTSPPACAAPDEAQPWSNSPAFCARQVPKLCLLLAVLEGCEVAELEYVPTVGSCAGLLVSNERFPAVAS